MLKYGCQCINCLNHTETGGCKETSITCTRNLRAGSCPVINCLSFKLKSPFTQVPCEYFSKIENSGLGLKVLGA